MLFILGVLVVIMSVFGGYSLVGDLPILWQPVEVIIIIGAGVGAMIIGNPASSHKKMILSLKNLFKGKPYTKKHYLEMIICLYSIFKLVKNKGAIAIESHIENPQESEIFKKSPSILRSHHTTAFICDYLRLITMGVTDPHHFEDLITEELEVFEEEQKIPGKMIGNFGESLPALGIVAAVLGVIKTMKSIDSPPEVLGGLIAAALVGTFLGIFCSYGIFSPMGSLLEKYAESEVEYYKCIKAGFISHLQGDAPTVTVEFIRKIIPDNLRPSFEETDEQVNNV